MKIRSTLLFSMLASLYAGMAFSQQLSSAQRLYENYKYEQSLRELHRIAVSKLSPSETAHYYELSGLNKSRLNNADLACTDYLKAKEMYASLHDDAKVAELDLELAVNINSTPGKINDARQYMDSYLAYAQKTNDPLTLCKAFKQLAAMNVASEPRRALSLSKQALAFNSPIRDSLVQAKILMNLSVIYNDVLDKPDSGLYFLQQAKLHLPKKNRGTNLCYALINEASAYKHLGNYKKAIELLHRADSLELMEFRKKIKSIVYQNLADNYQSLNQPGKALSYFQLAESYKDSLAEEKQEIAINDIQTQYDVKEKELRNFRLRVANYSIGGVLLAGTVLSLLGYKNLSKRRRIAEQQRLIETQKLEKALTDQELHEIDVMLETQEKERQRIADELHDELGSMLATLKLNFQNIEKNADADDLKNEQLYARTDALIEETYAKVRNISHLKNLGVVGNDGLLQSMRKMAAKMSIPGKFEVNIIPFGLTGRLDNQLEVTLFRIILELCTNVIKHASASGINLYITQHDATHLNIMIEDDGRGFDVSPTLAADGIGLRKIAKKIEQFGGTFTVDSIIGKGTTVVIDLPI